MCGIVGVLSRPASRRPPEPSDVLGGLDAAIADLGEPAEADAARLRGVVERLGRVDTQLRGVPGVVALIRNADLPGAIAGRLDRLDAAVRAIDERVEHAGAEVDPGAVEEFNAVLVG